MIPFAKKDDHERIFKNISELLTNLYKKNLRTKRLSEKDFINI